MTSPITPESRIAIIGAGIGGLSLALALARCGARNLKVFERRTDLQELGAGIQLGPNATRILRSWGLSEALTSVSERFPQGHMRDGISGSVLAMLPLNDLAEKNYGAPNCQLLRADLHQMLWRALCEEMQADPVVLGKELISVSQDSGEVAASFTDHVERADIVIGADGVDSRVRSLLVTDPGINGADVSYSGYYAWRGLVDASRLNDSERIQSMQVWMADSKHLVAYPLDNGRVINLVGISESSEWAYRTNVAESDPASWLQDFAGWDSNPLNLISALETCKKWALNELEPLNQWSQGAIGLLGDAAHPMMPSLAQGAAQAMEDAACLAGLIGEGTYPAEELLQTYFLKRAHRAEQVQRAALWNLEFFHRKNPLLRRARNIGMRLGGPLTTKMIARRYNWLYQKAD